MSNLMHQIFAPFHHLHPLISGIKIMNTVNIELSWHEDIISSIWILIIGSFVVKVGKHFKHKGCGRDLRMNFMD